MQAYRIHPGNDVAGLERVTLASPALGAHDVRIRIRAVALNYRDLMIARGYFTSGQPVIPCSDGAGEVLEVGSAVTRFKVGDRVVTSFFRDWTGGEATAENTAASLGGGVDGVLAEEIVLPEHGVAAMPAHLEFAEAATLPCTWVTAWNALFVAGGARPGATVLLLGTGGVSISALQLARAAGLRTIITSSSDAKLDRARSLGAHAGINYTTHPEWEQEVLRLTDGRGVDLVVEVGGENTAMRSAAATRMGGTMVIVGGVSGFGNALQPGALIVGAKRAVGVYVGSRAILEEVGDFVAFAGIRPQVDRVFDFAHAREAYAHLTSAQHFGKLVIRVAD